MAEDFIKFEINRVQFAAFLKAVFKVHSNFRIPFKLISLDFYKSERRIFKLKGPGGYQDLAPSTKRTKRAPIYPILKRTGVLEKSITSASARGSINKIGKKNLTIGTSIFYGRFQQEGTRTIPARQFVFIEGRGKSFPAGREFQGRFERWTGIISSFLEEVYESRGWDT